MENEKEIMGQEDVQREAAAIVRRRKVKRNLILILVSAVVVMLALGVTWNAGRKHEEEKNSDKIEELSNTIAEQAEEIERLKNTPYAVEPVAPEIVLDVVNTEIKGIEELATMEYLYTDAARYSDSKQIHTFDIPFTEKSFTIKWDGTIKAGVDVTQITTELNVADKVLVIHVPQAKILSHDPDEDSVEVLSEKDGLFNPVRVEDQTQFDAVSKKEMEERAVENGLLEKAQKNAEEVISKLLSANPDIKGNYTIKFEVDPG